MQHRIIYFIIFLSLLTTSKGYGQDLSKLGENEMLVINGNISFDQMFVPNFWSGTNTRDPYSYFLVGGLNMSFYGISMPMNFSYTNQNLGYSHPFTFNQFGAQPSYKWVKTYIGYNSISLSPYTLNGHQFCGFGVELTPPDIPVALTMVYGRLLKATEYESEQTIPAYKRMGVGFKSSVTLKSANLNTSVFYSWDEENSILPLPDTLGISPKENIAVSFEGGIRPLKGLSIDFNVGNSVITDDKFSAISNERKFWGGIFPARSSTSSYWAYKTGINYGISMGSVGLAYERVQPEFNTLGAYYFVNDLENITVNSSARVLDGKLNIGGNIGIQRDNLNNHKLFSNRRVVGAGNVSLSVNQNLNFTTSYSSFTSFTHLRSVFDHINSTSPYQNLDTLNFTQINRSGTFNVTYGFGSVSVKQTSNLSLSGNQSLNKQETSSSNDDIIFINCGITHSIALSESGWAFSVSSFFSSNQNPLGTNNTFGPYANVSKSLKDGKIRASLGATYNKTWLNSSVQSTNLNIRLTGSWSFLEGHSVSSSGGYFNVSSPNNINNGRQELVFNLMYSYNFSHKYSPKKKTGSNSTL